MSRLFVLIPAAGGGARFGGRAPKQYAPLNGRPLLACTIDRLQDALAPELVAVALGRDDVAYEREIGPRERVTALRCGGPTRGETVASALLALRSTCNDDDWLLVHDAARPCVPRDALARLTAHLEHDATGGLLAIPLADTLKRSDGDADAPRVVATLDRARLWQAQTPQMFRYGVLARAFAAPGARDCTDEAQAVEALGLEPRLVRGSPANIKVTFPDDMALAAAILAAQANEDTR
jgi:2-C-methyl-D-erythritol 4-phosphate cytidylyltransferase